MFKKIQYILKITLLLSTPWYAVTVNAQQNDVVLAEQYLKIADKYRQAEDAMKISTEIALYKNGQLKKSKHYTVYSNTGRKSLVLMDSKTEKGQRVLMLDDKFWMILLKSRRPIRITPMQKLLGEASTGDIATLKWQEDFSAELVANDNADIDVLKLTAKRKGTTYKTIELVLEKNSHKPRSAKLFVASGKLAKTAIYKIGLLNGVEQVVSMTLLDKINKSKKTIITYLNMEPYKLADKYFNPSYLVKKPKVE